MGERRWGTGHRPTLRKEGTVRRLAASWGTHTHFCGREMLHNSHKHENTTNTQRKIHTRAHKHKEKKHQNTHIYMFGIRFAQEA